MDTQTALGEVTDPSGEQNWLGEAATRRMCAGALIDEPFRDTLLGNVYNDRSRRVAPSYGFDLISVLHYAWRAWWLEFCLRCLLLAAVAVAFVRAPLDTIIALSMLTLWYLVRSLPDLTEKYTGYYIRGEGYEPEIRRIEFRGRSHGFAVLVSLVVLATAMALSLSVSNRSGSTATWVAKTGLTSAAVIAASWAGLVAAATLIRLWWLRRLRIADPERPRRLGARMKVIDQQQSHPLTVYSGFRPFVGSGATVLSWSFAQRLVPEIADEGTPKEFADPPFRTTKLVKCLWKEIASLCTDSDPETALPGLEVAHSIFIEGAHAESSALLTRSTFSTRTVQAEILKAIRNPGGAIRHYLACRVASWGGEVVTTVHVHASLQGRTLYLEFATQALLPTRARYHLVDQPSMTGPAALAKGVAGSLVRLPEELWAVPRVLGGPTQIWAAIRPRKDRTFRRRDNMRADIGAAMSAREAAAVEAKESYFQTQDIWQHSKIIERRLIATVADFLAAHNVDTAEFLDRATTILNNGIMNMGSGNVNVTGSAVGDQSNVTNQGPASGNKS